MAKKKSNNRTTLIGLGVFVVVVVLASLGYLFFGVLGNEQGLEITGYFDENGDEINTQEQAVVGGIEGVSYITVRVNAKNTDSVELEVELTEITPSFVEDAFDLTDTQIAAPGETVSWDSDLIDIRPYIGTQQTIVAKAKFSSASRQDSISTSAPKTVTIEADASAAGSVVVETTTEGDDDPITPPEGGDEEEPPVDDYPDFETNAVPGAYNNYKSGTWIKVDENGDGVLEEYVYKSAITAGTCGGTYLTVTPEGYTVNRYSGSSGLSIFICNPSAGGYKRYG